MELIKSLYQIMLMLSAFVMILGLILNLNKLREKKNEIKISLLLSLVNVFSILIFIFQISPATESQFRDLFIFFDITILILNLILGRYILIAKQTPKNSFEKSILELFIVTFVLNCIVIFVVYYFQLTDGILNPSKPGFYFLYAILITLLLWGSILPAIIAWFQKRITNKQTLLLLVLNALNNLIGLTFYTLKFPNSEIGIILNILINLIFAYYLAYYLIYNYFAAKKSQYMSEKSHYSWDELKKHLNSWNEVKTYLEHYDPNLIEEIEKLALSDLEKIHLSLKSLRISTKDVSIALNVTARTVETQRYRIKKKLS